VRKRAVFGVENLLNNFADARKKTSKYFAEVVALPSKA
jgi:hypothetical protein